MMMPDNGHDVFSQVRQTIFASYIKGWLEEGMLGSSNAMSWQSAEVVRHPQPHHRLGNSHHQPYVYTTPSFATPSTLADSRSSHLVSLVIL
jgi:hypothetical protein